MNVNSDFLGDFSTHLKSCLSSLGYAVSPTITIDDLTYQFFSVWKRRIVATPRVVHESQSLVCPPHLISGYEILKKKFQIGEDVTPHLSNSVDQLYTEDLLLNDWGIHHFHLGRQKANGRITRTGPVLFALVNHTDVYFLTIMHHGSGHYPWSEQELIKTIHREWPSAIEMYRLKGITGGLSRPVDNEAVKILRNFGIQTMVQVEPDAVYGPIGGGYSTAKTSIAVRRNADYFIKQVRDIEKYMRDNSDFIAQKIFDLTNKLPLTLDLKLQIDNDGFYVVENDSKVAFHVLEH